MLIHVAIPRRLARNGGSRRKERGSKIIHQNCSGRAAGPKIVSEIKAVHICCDGHLYMGAGESQISI